MSTTAITYCHLGPKLIIYQPFVQTRRNQGSWGRMVSELVQEVAEGHACALVAAEQAVECDVARATGARDVEAAVHSRDGPCQENKALLVQIVGQRCRHGIHPQLAPSFHENQAEGHTRVAVHWLGGVHAALGTEHDPDFGFCYDYGGASWPDLCCVSNKNLQTEGRTLHVLCLCVGGFDFDCGESAQGVGVGAPLVKNYEALAE